MGFAQDRPDEKRRKILCTLLDIFDGTIINDWTGKDMSNEEAKLYIMEYK